MRKLVAILVLGLAGLPFAAGCHADPDDPAGQAKELSDPVRRENAIANLTRLYTGKLQQHQGNRAHAEVKGVADAMHAELTKTYIDHPEDNTGRRHILDLMFEMRDARTLPALIEALDWRPEVSEEHAIRAAQTFQAMDVPAADKPRVVAKLGEALAKISGSRPVDNRMRIEMIRALGTIHDRSATPILVRITTAQTDDQNFLINRLAGEQLGRIGDPAALPAMMKALFMFDPNAPQRRMNDVAAEALVRIGRPALQPLLAVLRGEDREANRIAQQYIDAIRQRDQAAAAQLNVRTITSNEAAFTLGQLGAREALEPLLAEAQLAGEENAGRRFGAGIALVSINRNEADNERVRTALRSVYTASDKAARPQLLVAFQHALDPGLMQFLLEQARTPEDEVPEIRLSAFTAYAMLANKQEAAAARAVIDGEPAEGGFKQNFQQSASALAAANECDQDVACWARKLADRDKMVARKATYMLARYGRGNPAAIRALIGALDRPDVDVRVDVLYALDQVTVRGSAEAVAKLDEVRQREEGRQIWEHTKQIAMPIQARIRNRSQGAS